MKILFRGCLILLQIAALSLSMVGRTAATSTFPPTNVVATPGNGQVTVSWTNASGVNSYELIWSDVAGAVTGVNPNPGSLHYVGPTTSPVLITGLTNGTRYYFGVVGVVPGNFVESPLKETYATPPDGFAPPPPPPAPPIVPSRVLIVYENNSSASSWDDVSDSYHLALYYAQKRGVPASNLVGTTKPDYYGYGEPDGYIRAYNDIFAPIKAKLAQLGPTNIDVILLAGLSTYGLTSADGRTIISFDNTLMGLNVLDPSTNNINTYGNPYIDNAPPFTLPVGHFDHSLFKLNGTEMYMVARVSTPEEIDQALYADTYVSPQAGYYNGNAYVANGWGAYTDDFLAADPYVQSGAFGTYNSTDENIAWSEHFITPSGFPLKWANAGGGMGTPGAKFMDGTSAETAPRTLFYGGWYNISGVPDGLFEWLPGSVADDLNSSGFFGAQALSRGASCAAYVVSEPYTTGCQHPDVWYDYILNGYTWAEASTLATPTIGWQATNEGDPLYAPTRVRTVIKDTQLPALSAGYPFISAGTSPADRIIHIMISDQPQPEVVKVQADYGLTTAYGSTANSQEGYYRRPNVLLAGLQSNTVYHYRLRITDPVGNVTTTGDYSFSTAPAPIISAAPAAFNFWAALGGSNPGAQSVTVTNSGAGTLNWTVTHSPSWLTVSPAGGGNGPTSVTLTAHIAGLSAGTYNDTLVFTDPNAQPTQKTVPVALLISASNQPPIAQSQTVTTRTDKSKAIQLIAMSPEDQPLTYTIVTPPTHGTLIGTAPLMIYTANPGYTGSDSFTFKVNDGALDSNIAPVTITLKPVNSPPVADFATSGNSGSAPYFVVFSAIGSSDADGSIISYFWNFGDGQAEDSRVFTSHKYTTPGTYTVVLTVTDNDNATATASQVITVNTLSNQPPVAQDQPVTTPVDTAKAITLVATDPENQPLTYTIVAQPTHGSLAGTAPNVTYTPTAGYTGPDIFTFRANDGALDSNIATVSITVTGVNNPPVAQDQFATTPEDTAKAITLVATDPDNQTLTYTIVAQPAHGSLAGIAPNVSYTPAANYNGPDSFTFKANDGTLDSNMATVTITVTAVNDPPAASFTASPISGLAPLIVSFDASGSSDVDGTVSSYAWNFGDGQTGSGVTVSHTYTTAGAYTAALTVTDNQNAAAIATKVISVNTLSNQPPVAQDQPITTPQNTAKAITLVGTDPENQSLTYAIVTPPAHGALSGTAPNVTYTPASNYSGPDSFTFKANDGTLDSNIATVSIVVTSINQPPVALDQAVTTPEDTAKAITLVATDPENQPLTYTIVAQPTHGSLAGTAPNVTYTPAANYNGSDSFTFKANDGILNSNIAKVSITVTAVNDPPTASFTASPTSGLAPLIVSFDATGSSDVDGTVSSYAWNFGDGQTGSGVTVSHTYTTAGAYTAALTVTDNQNATGIASKVISVNTLTNQPPVAQDQTLSTPVNTAKSIKLVATDPDNQTLTYSVVASPAHGTLSGTAPNLTYTPAANYSGSDSFTFKANDGTLNSNIATVTIAVMPKNQPPVAQDQPITTPENTAKAITLVATDPENHSLTYAIVASPAHGSLSGTAPQVIYTPAPNYSGADSFTFKANDGTQDSNPATVSITVTSTNGGGLLPPTLDLPKYLPINAQISAGYNGSAPADHFDWSFVPDNSLPSSGLQTQGSSIAAPPASFSTKSSQANLGLQHLGLGPYKVTVTVFSGNNSLTSKPASVTMVPADLSTVRVYPNPWRSDRHANRSITFDGLAINSTVKLFTVSGHWIKTLPLSSSSVTWDLTNNSGDKVASGNYVYLITTDSGAKKTGQIAVIK